MNDHQISRMTACRLVILEITLIQSESIIWTIVDNYIIIDYFELLWIENCFFHSFFAFDENAYCLDVVHDDPIKTTSISDSFENLSLEKYVDLVNSSVELVRCRNIIVKLQKCIKSKSKDITNLKRMNRYYTKSNKVKSEKTANLTQDQSPVHSIESNVKIFLIRIFTNIHYS